MSVLCKAWMDAVTLSLEPLQMVDGAATFACAFSFLLVIPRLNRNACGSETITRF